MTTDRFGGAWTDGYNGFTRKGGPQLDTGLRIERPATGDPGPRQFTPEEYRLPPRPGFKRGVSRGMLLGGVGVALGLGLLFGVFAKPDLVEPPTREPMQPVTTSAAGGASSIPVPVEVAPAPTPGPTPTPEAGGKLEVLPPELARAADARAANASTTAPSRREPQREAPPVDAPAPQAREAPAPRPAVEPRRTTPSAAEPRVAEPAPGPSFNCRYAGTRAERMVCDDPELARLDRRLDGAFEQAVASGVPYRPLRAEQDDWLSIREDAARRSPAAVASVYRQRIAELNALSR